MIYISLNNIIIFHLLYNLFVIQFLFFFYGITLVCTCVFLCDFKYIIFFILFFLFLTCRWFGCYNHTRNFMIMMISLYYSFLLKRFTYCFRLLNTLIRVWVYWRCPLPTFNWCFMFFVFSKCFNSDLLFLLFIKLCILGNIFRQLTCGFNFLTYKLSFANRILCVFWFALKYKFWVFALMCLWFVAFI